MKGKALRQVTGVVGDPGRCAQSGRGDHRLHRSQQASSSTFRTPPAPKVLELSLREAPQFGHNYIGTEHAFKLPSSERVKASPRCWSSWALSWTRVRQQVIQLLSGYQGKAPPKPHRRPRGRVRLRLRPGARPVRPQPHGGGDGRQTDPVIGHEKEAERGHAGAEGRTKNEPRLSCA